MTGKSPAPVSLPDTMAEVLHQDGKEPDAHCLEKRVYYKVISGMLKTRSFRHFIHHSHPKGLHASISTHICHEYLNQTTGEWVCVFDLFPCLIDSDISTAPKSQLFHQSSCVPPRTPSIYLF